MVARDDTSAADTTARQRNAQQHLGSRCATRPLATCHQEHPSSGTLPGRLLLVGAAPGTPSSPPPPCGSRSTHGAVKRPSPPHPHPRRARPNRTPRHPGPAPQSTSHRQRTPQKQPKKHLWTFTKAKQAISVTRHTPKPRPHRNATHEKVYREKTTRRHHPAKRSLGLYGMRKNYIEPLSP